MRILGGLADFSLEQCRCKAISGCPIGTPLMGLASARFELRGEEGLTRDDHLTLARRIRDGHVAGIDEGVAAAARAWTIGPEMAALMADPS
jgi:hypothetical protein